MSVRLAFAALALGAAGSAAAAPFQDGGFENQYSGSSFCYYSSCPGTDWQAGGAFGAVGGAGIVNENNGDWPGVQTTGTYHAFVQGNTFLYQFFDAAQTGTFRLTWADAGRSRPGYDGAHNYVARVIENFGVENTLAEVARTTTPSTGFTPVTSGSFQLVAGRSYQVVFSGATASDTTSFIDDVAFQAAGGVPEPANWALMIAGFGLLGVAARRRRPVAVAA